MYKIFKITSLLLICSIALSSALAADQPDAPPSEAIELIGVGHIGASATDHSGLSEKLDAELPHNLLGGFSGIAYAGQGNLYYMVPDRGPRDGAVPWKCRVQLFSMVVDQNSDPVVQLRLKQTIMLTDEAGRPFVGAAAATQAGSDHAIRFDPEGIRVGPHGNLFISDEYGPRIFEFRPDGRMVKELGLPSRFLIENSCPTSDEENAVNESGRQANRGMEGLAISPNGEELFGLLQSPLLQDCERPSLASKPVGMNCRLLKMSTDGSPKSELVYHLDNKSNKLNEILSVSDREFLVIERDGNAGADAKFKKLILVSTHSATDVSDYDQLPPYDLPKDVNSLQKTVLIDLLDSQWKLAGDQMPEKIEGLAFGPDLPDGRRLLIVGSDNDFQMDSPSVVYVFAVPEKLLHLN